MQAIDLARAYARRVSYARGTLILGAIRALGLFTGLLLIIAMCMAPSAAIAQPTNGLTVIAHGFQPLFSGSPDWLRSMAKAMRDRRGVDIPVYRAYFNPGGLGTADDKIDFFKFCPSLQLPCPEQVVTDV